VAFTYLKVKSIKCLCVLPVVLVLLLWSWSYEFGLVTSLVGQNVTGCCGVSTAYSGSGIESHEPCRRRTATTQHVNETVSERFTSLIPLQSARGESFIATNTPVEPS